MAVRRRGELEAPGVEEQAFERDAVRTGARTTSRRPGPVDSVAGNRMADRVEVNADLMRPAGHEVQLEQRPAGEALAHAISRRRRPAIRDDSHPGSVLRIASDRRFDPADLGPDLAQDESEVGLLDPARL